MGTRRALWRRLMALALGTLFLFIITTATTSAQDSGTSDSGDTTALETVSGTDFAPASAIDGLELRIDTTWVLLTGMLVFFMQTGFAMLEAGFIRHTGVVNALLENFMDAGLTGLMFWAVGYGLAFGTTGLGGLVGTDNFFLGSAVTFQNGTAVYGGGGGMSEFAFFFFQFAFAATASTIATGAMAERTDFIGDVIYSALIAAIIYPVVVHWVWGGGWLGQNGFLDFAGSTVVHSVGGYIALIGAIMLGPRKGRVFGKPPQPHNMALATIGTMILWFGWYGFNPGSTLGMGNDGLVGLVTVNTTLAASAGTMSAMFYMYFRTGKWDLGFTLNGSLAGLVAITAGCAFVAPWAAVVIGLIAGIIVVVSVDVIEKLKIDDPVGAFSVHGACGIFGTLAIGLFGQAELTGSTAGLFLGGGLSLFITQLIGVAAVLVWVGLCSVVMFSVLKSVKRLRVNAKADEIGIDVYEHGASLWPDVLPMGEETVSSAPGTVAAPAVGD